MFELHGYSAAHTAGGLGGGEDTLARGPGA